MTRNRAGAILIENNKVLLIHRIKDSKEFWVFSGGGIEEGETPEETIIREMLEETSLVVKIKSLAIEIQTNLNNKLVTETYYLVNRISGKPQISINSPEAARMLESKNENFYELVWIPITELNTLVVYPVEVKNFVCSLN